MGEMQHSKGNAGTETNDRPSAVNTLSIMLEMFPERTNIAVQSLSVGNIAPPRLLLKYS